MFVHVKIKVLQIVGYSSKIPPPNTQKIENQLEHASSVSEEFCVTVCPNEICTRVRPCINSRYAVVFGKDDPILRQKRGLGLNQKHGFHNVIGVQTVTDLGY